MSKICTDDFAEFLKHQLEELQLDASILAAYLIGILEDETLTEEEKLEAIKTTVEDIRCDDNFPNTFSADILRKWQELADSTTKINNKSISLRAALNSDIVINPLEKVQNFNECTKHFTEDDKKQMSIKKNLVAQYAFEQVATIEFDETGAMICTKGTPLNASNREEDTWFNDNRLKVQRQQQLQRTKAKEEHEKDVLKRLEQKRLEDSKKAKEKQRVSKKERRTGR